MRKGFFLLLVAGSVIALLVAGCGGGGGSGNDEVTASSISKAEFITKADAACVKAEKKMQAEYGAYLSEIADESQKNKEDTVKHIVDTILIPNIDQELEEIRALGAPQGDVPQIKAIVAGVEKTLEKREAEPETAMNEAFWGEASLAAAKYGFNLCGKH